MELEHGSIDSDTGHITLNLASTQSSAKCPGCQQLSHRTHSSYERTLRDLNWAECAVTLQLKMHKFFCVNRACQRRIFTERLPQLVEPWARRTNRMTQQIRGLGLALGGAAGARLSQQLGYSFSRDTVLRCLAKASLPSLKLSQTIGVDDFAFRKGIHKTLTNMDSLQLQRPTIKPKD